MSLTSIRSWLVCVGALLPAALIAAPIPDGKGSGETPVEKVRKALQQQVTLEIKDATLENAIADLKKESKVNLVLDKSVVPVFDPAVQQFLPPGVPIQPAPGQQATVSLSAKNMKVRDALKQILSGENLTYVILGDEVLITTEAMAIQRQLKQHVSLDFDAVPFNQAIKQLARETGANLIVDGKLKKETETAVSLQLEDVPLDTAVRLLAEAAGLKPVRLGNVIYLTTKANATELRSDPELFPQQSAPNPQAELQWKLQQQLGGWGQGLNLGGIVTPTAPPVLPPPPAPEKDEKDK